MKVLGRFNLPGLLFLANCTFWLAFGIAFAGVSRPYKPHSLAFEEITPRYIFFGRALPETETGTGVGVPPAMIKTTYGRVGKTESPERFWVPDPLVLRVRV
jgi:hypothetical protein